MPSFDYSGLQLTIYGVQSLYYVLSFLPIVGLIVLSLTVGVRAAVFASFGLTTVVFFVSGSGPLTFSAALVGALVNTLTILMIIFGAICLYQVMEQKGFIKRIEGSLQNIHPDRSFRFFFLVLFLTPFFESVAGFGTPGAIVPLLLVALGYSAVRSISAVLLIDGCFALTGALGTPVIAGLELPLSLSSGEVGRVYGIASIVVFCAGFIALGFIYRGLRQETEERQTRAGWLLYACVLVPYVGTIVFLRELAGLVAPLVMAVIAYAFLFTNKTLRWKPWLPYHLLVLLLIVPRWIPGLAEVVATKWEITHLFGTAVPLAFQPLRSPLLPFLVAGLFALSLSRTWTFNIRPVLGKTFAVFLILFPSLAITQLMIHSGGGFPSMVEAIAEVFSKKGDAYPLASPLIGILGSFITGSTTVSNLIFGPIQFQAAGTLGFPVEVILALQLAGASIGNAVCLFNIIAAAAVVGLRDYTSILKHNLLPVLLGSLTCSLLGYLFIWVL